MYIYQSKRIAFDMIFVKIPVFFFHCLLILNRDVHQLYTHSNDFLLMVTYTRLAVSKLWRMYIHVHVSRGLSGEKFLRGKHGGIVGY